MARSKKACIVFFDEVDAIGGARFDDSVGGDNEVQCTMLGIVFLALRNVFIACKILSFS